MAYTDMTSVYLERRRPVCLIALPKYTRHIHRGPWHPQAASQLVRLGRWYATLPTSNVASERVFGVVRGLEDDQRRSASEETVTIETLARCNSWLVDVVREKHGRV